MLRAAELECQAVLKATNVDGVYTADPKKDPKAKRYDRSATRRRSRKTCRVMDGAAFALARENRMPIIVFSIREQGRDRGGAARQGQGDDRRLDRATVGIDKKRSGELPWQMQRTTSTRSSAACRARVAALKGELSGLRTGRASAHMLDPVDGRCLRRTDAAQPGGERHGAGTAHDLRQCLGPLAGPCGGKGDRAIPISACRRRPKGRRMRLRIPELNEERRKELVKIAHKYAETARVAARHVRRDGMDVIKKLEKDHKISKDDHDRFSADVQKATDSGIARDRPMLAAKEKEILTV